MPEYKFVMLLSNKEKLKSVFTFFSVICCLIVAGYFLTIFWNNISIKLPFLNYMRDYVKLNVGEFTIIGSLFSSFFGTLFFVPSPDEIIFYYALSKNTLIMYTLIAFIVGYLLAQSVNYYLGLKTSNYILNFMSKKKLYQSRRYVNKYGGIGIFIFNFLPFPSPLLSFALGIAKYNFKRLMLWSFIGRLLKFLAVIIIYLAISQI